MEKDTNRGSYTLQEDEKVGVVQIADDVIEVIAGLAATEVEGVSAMAGNITNDLLKKVGGKSLSKGVKVEVINGQVTVELAVVMGYGYNIPTTCGKIQEKVKSTIENMTGLTVSNVNIRIAGVDMKNGN